MRHLSYWESGKEGAPPLLFIHGWTCNHTTMQPLVDRFTHDHWCITPDLNGHGGSLVPGTGYSIHDQCNLLATDLGDTLAEMVVIGHSMGGQIALELAARKAVRAAVLLDPAPILPHDKARQWGEDLRVQLKKVNIPAMMSAFARNQFRHAADPAMVDTLVKTMQACDADVVIAAWDGIMDYDGKAALETLERPCLTIFADKPLNDVKGFARSSKYMETAQTACSGHMQQLEVPDQLDAMIRRFLQLLDKT